MEKNKKKGRRMNTTAEAVCVKAWRAGKWVTYQMLLFRERLSSSGERVTAEVGYRGSIWNISTEGDIQRVSNGKRIILATDAHFIKG
jgi:hypothetical protein